MPSRDTIQARWSEIVAAVMAAGIPRDDLTIVAIIAGGQHLERGADAIDATVEVLPPVAGDENQLLVFVEEREARAHLGAVVVDQ